MPLSFTSFDSSVSAVSPLSSADTKSLSGAPLTRGATTADGAGLGLSIVQAILEGVGGGIAFVSPAPGQADGLAVEVRLPASKPASG